MKRPKFDPNQDVKVQLSSGCALDGRTDQHTRTQADWRDLIDNTPLPWERDDQ
jgi:hypothetical protein